MDNIDDRPEYVKARLDSLYADAAPILEQTRRFTLEAKTKDFSDFREDAAKRLVKEILVGPRRELHVVLQKHIQDAQQGKQRIKGLIKSYSMPKKQEDPSAQIELTLGLQEIRSLLRAEPDPIKTKAMVQDNAKNGDGRFVMAVSSGPDRATLLPGDALWDCQRQWAFRQNGDLAGWEFQTNESARIIRRACGQINESQQLILMDQGYEDPLSRSVHFTTFQPESQREQLLANDLLLKEMQAEMAEENKEKLRESHSGINL